MTAAFFKPRRSTRVQLPLALQHLALQHLAFLHRSHAVAHQTASLNTRCRPVETTGTTVDSHSADHQNFRHWIHLLLAGAGNSARGAAVLPCPVLPSSLGTRTGGPVPARHSACSSGITKSAQRQSSRCSSNHAANRTMSISIPGHPCSFPGRISSRTTASCFFAS